jgi:membrane protein DedA with SNARE-associated domain
MNFTLTSLWLGFMTLLGYFLGDNFTPEHIGLTAFAFFFVALIIRFLPNASGDVIGGLLD